MATELKAWLVSVPEITSSARLQSLFSDISRQKVSNPDGYHANVSWWRKALTDLASKGLQLSRDHLVIHVNNTLVSELASATGQRPLALSSAITEMLASRDIIPLELFLDSSQRVTESSPLSAQVAQYVFTKPLWWAMEQLGIVADDPDSIPYEQRWRRAQGSYVLIRSVEAVAKAVISLQHKTTTMQLEDSLFDTALFRAKFGHLFGTGSPTDLDILIILRYLERDSAVVVREGDVIKFCLSTNTEPITDLDRNFVRLRSATRNLESQIDDIQQKIEERTGRAKEFVVLKQTEIAKSYLRSRKLLEELLAKRLNSLSTLQSVLLKIESAAGDIQIMQVYETSTSTLKSLLAHPKLQASSVNETISRLSDTLADHADIEEAISIGGELAQRSARYNGVDEAELDDELAALTAEELALQILSPPMGTPEAPEQDIGAERVRRANEDVHTVPQLAIQTQ